MTPDRRKEVRLADDASYRTRTAREIDELKERIKALESLLADAGGELWLYGTMINIPRNYAAEAIIERIDAILQKTEEVK